MLEVNATIQEKNALHIAEPKQAADHMPFQQKLIAIACVSFFPLVYLIGSTVVKYFG